MQILHIVKPSLGKWEITQLQQGPGGTDTTL